MRQHHRALLSAGVAACLLAIAREEVSAQRSRILEFGPDAIDLGPHARVVIGRPLTAPEERDAGQRRPWVLSSGSELRLPPPPDEAEASRERRELRRLVVREDAATLDRIRYWDFRSPGHRWNELLVTMVARDRLGATAGIRAFALLNIAIDDSLIAAWDSKYAYRRLRPIELDGSLVPEVTVPSSPSYPCERAVTAGAASAVLAHLFPADAERLAAAAHEAAWSRVVAGAVYPSDARAGLELGRAVAARVIARARIEPARGATVSAGRAGDAQIGIEAESVSVRHVVDGRGVGRDDQVMFDDGVAIAIAERVSAAVPDASAPRAAREYARAYAGLYAAIAPRDDPLVGVFENAAQNPDGDERLAASLVPSSQGGARPTALPPRAGRQGEGVSPRRRTARRTGRPTGAQPATTQVEPTSRGHPRS